MTTMIVTRVFLAPRERQVLEGLTAGNTLAVVAQDLKIREGTQILTTDQVATWFRCPLPCPAWRLPGTGPSSPVDKAQAKRSPY
ncbi:hypothetical protein [Streptomyces sp. NPDC051662]|uniref:hypothetical protein n=1 Tax=Streptomyces sp. NPDC051662 TaxID=3154750 RepID=UPI00344232AD